MGSWLRYAAGLMCFCFLFWAGAPCADAASSTVLPVAVNADHRQQSASAGMVASRQKAGESAVSSTRKVAHPWRIAYIEGGPFVNYQQMLSGLARGLAKLGVIQNGRVPIPEGTESTEAMWQWLADNAGGEKATFLKDGYYSANWDADQRIRVREEILSRIARGEIDMVLALGTWSALDMATTVKNIPVFAMSVSDAVGAGIIQSPEDSGRDNLHAYVDPGRYGRQIEIFHDVFGFKKLGIAYEDTPEGRSTCALPELEQAAKQLGIELVRCTTRLDLPDDKVRFQNLSQCISQLSQESDAIYLTLNSGMQGSRMVELLNPIIEAGLPSFSQTGAEEVRLGVLMSLAQTDFAADSIRQVIEGAKPRDVNQIFQPAVGLALNLKMAMRIGWNPPLEVLAAVDAFYEQIQNGAQ